LTLLSTLGLACLIAGVFVFFAVLSLAGGRP
jgi:hypothetical protein